MGPTPDDAVRWCAAFSRSPSVRIRDSPALEAPHPSMPQTSCTRSGNPGESARRLHARESDSTCRISTHGPRVTTRERSKRGSDAAAFEARAQGTRYVLFCASECHANYGVHATGRMRFFCNESAIYQQSVLDTPDTHVILFPHNLRTSFIRATTVYQWQARHPPDRVTGASAKAAVHLQHHIDAGQFPCPSSQA